jgi:hypothetical protein
MVYWLVRSANMRNVWSSNPDQGAVIIYLFAMFNLQKLECLSGFEPEYSRMVSELANHLTTNWYSSLSSFKRFFKHFGVSRNVAHDAQVSATRRTVSLRHIYRSRYLIESDNSHGVLVNVHAYHGWRSEVRSRAWHYYYELGKFNF